MQIINRAAYRKEAHERALSTVLDKLRPTLTDVQTGDTALEKAGGDLDADRRFVLMTGDGKLRCLGRPLFENSEGDLRERLEEVRPAVEDALGRYDPETEGVVVWLPSREVEEQTNERMDALTDALNEDVRFTPVEGDPPAVVAVFDLAE